MASQAKQRALAGPAKQGAPQLSHAPLLTTTPALITSVCSGTGEGGADPRSFLKGLNILVVAVKPGITLFSPSPALDR